MKARVLPLPGDEHAAVQALLPWYLNGALAADERAGVAAHLAGCAACRAELEGERRLQAVHAGVEASPGELASDWAALRRRIDVPRPAPPGPGIRPAWRTLAMLQFALLLLALGLWAADRPAPARYTAQGAAGRDAGAVVRFRPETREQDIRRLLRDSGTRLVGGPTLSDAYLLELPPADPAAALVRLRADPQVLMAESLDARGAR